ncbi:MAG: superoxide dismutase [Promethearchaeota archaeon]
MKIFAYNITKEEITMDKFQPFLKEVAQHAWDLYKRGILREFYFRTDKLGAMLILEYKDVNEAKNYIKELLFVKEGLVEYEFVPVGAFALFENLFK